MLKFGCFRHGWEREWPGAVCGQLHLELGRRGFGDGCYGFHGSIPGDGLPRSPNRHNGGLYLQDGLFAHFDCLSGYPFRLAQGSDYSLGNFSAWVVGSPPASYGGVSVVVGRLPAWVAVS